MSKYQYISHITMIHITKTNHKVPLSSTMLYMQSVLNPMLYMQSVYNPMQKRRFLKYSTPYQTSPKPFIIQFKINSNARECWIQNNHKHSIRLTHDATTTLWWHHTHQFNWILSNKVQTTSLPAKIKHHNVYNRQLPFVLVALFKSSH